jgi:hypothetical protein
MVSRNVVARLKPNDVERSKAEDDCRRNASCVDAPCWYGHRNAWRVTARADPSSRDRNLCLHRPQRLLRTKDEEMPRLRAKLRGRLAPTNLVPRESKSLLETGL